MLFTEDEIKAKTKERLESNFRLLNLLKRYLIEYPDTRFGQALVNLDVVVKNEDPFYPESKDVLARAEAAGKKVGL